MEKQNLSVTGKNWQMSVNSVGKVISQQLGLAEVVGRVLTNRQPNMDAENAYKFLFPNFSHMPDPLSMKDMETAIKRIYQAIKAGEKIAVFGDYDVDGACSSALLIRYFRELNIEITAYIPNRMTEGYGPNSQAMEKLYAEGTKLVITVDCGSTADEALQKAQDIGLDVIVTDHHQCLPILPPSVAVVNPNRVDENGELAVLSGAGVAFYLAMALNRYLREKDFFNKDVKEPDLKQVLDLVALSIICDMVPLTGVNRPLVQRGLQMLNMRVNTGLNAILQIANINEEINTYHAGFQIGPRLNASGRLAESDMATKLLSTEDAQEAADIALRMQKLNEERKLVQEDVQNEAMIQAEKQAKNSVIIVSGKGWHPGVVGIVAARVKEQFYKPTFVISIGEDGTATGSGRSISGIDLGHAVQQCHKHTMRGGGHAMAAGVTVEEIKLEAFTKAMVEAVEKQAEDNLSVWIPALKLDGILPPSGMTINLLEQLEKLQPYGMGNREPVFALVDVIIKYVKNVGADQRHIKLGLQGMEGSRVDGISFGAMDSDLGPFLQQNKGKKVTLAGTVKANNFGGRLKVDFHVQDAHAKFF